MSETKSYYLVLGWRTDPTKGFVIIFEATKSSTPGPDVERALDMGCSFVRVELLAGKVPEQLKETYAKLFAHAAPRNREGRYFDLPLLGGVLSYRVDGYVPTGKFHPVEKGRMLYRTAFETRISANPSQDVERALRLGCTRMSVSVNYEPTEDEKRQREQRQEGGME